VDIPKLSTIAQNMVRDAIDSFVKKDIGLARKVVLSDPEADKLRNAVQDELINEYMARDATTAPRAVPLLLIARHLERICDHTTNIAEDVIYMVEGKVVKHHSEEL
jgi:phosphate transport system protein